MPHRQEKTDILVVDDKPDNLLAIDVTLEPLMQNVVLARSGREALRHVLKREFAVILLDIHMPTMDGFETAELIRQHRGSRHTPIIFVTANSEDLFIERSYALGAVDYILTPIAPTVLRSKVGVFVELFAKTRETRRQAEYLERQTARLRKLTSASLQINAALSIDAMVESIANTAREILGAREATVEVTPHRPHEQTRTRVARTTFDAADAVAENPRTVITRLAAGDGRPMGHIEVRDPQEAAHAFEDEAFLAQLGQVASVAIQN
ncbi:MAG: response regulator, partial [Polyangiaceae bacterium]|nr:response regulator [Polyangiaceae bacterium]